MTGEQSVVDDERFAFGENWTRFVKGLNEDKIRFAEQALADMLQCEDLKGKTFLDIGSGSGLSSLAARRLGAQVHSFDYDPQSVSCTQQLKAKYHPDDELWQVERGSALDGEYLASLGCFDIVYSWGVLHHTGDMWSAFAGAAPLVKDGGTLYIAIYNDEGWKSRFWYRVKKAYCRNFLT